MNYRGRFAPSPSGPLHFGSLLAALASYLQAKANQGKWLVRIEDIDSPRAVPNSDKVILKSLEAFHLYWDEAVIYQTQRQQRYQEIIKQLTEQNYLYPCSCSRKEIGSQPYSGKCRQGINTDKKTLATRIKTHSKKIAFTDRVQGPFSQQLDKDVGDFIIKRADDITAYNLAVVVDDADQAITEIVRGTDLIDTTPRQIYLQQILGFTTPSYLHIPIAMDLAGNKLSKQNHAPEINTTHTHKLLINALAFLGQAPATELCDASNEEIIQWALTHWDINRIPQRQQITYSTA